MRARAFAPFLLDGVTGSGKTETYFEPLATAIRQGRQVLVLRRLQAQRQPLYRRCQYEQSVAQQ